MAETFALLLVLVMAILLADDNLRSSPYWIEDMDSSRKIISCASISSVRFVTATFIFA